MVGGAVVRPPTGCRGWLSMWSQISAAVAVCSALVMVWPVSSARCRNNATAWSLDRGGTVIRCSSSQPTGSRLVATTVSSGTASSRPGVRSATPARTCSQLSRTSTVRGTCPAGSVRVRVSRRASRAERPEKSVSITTWATSSSIAVVSAPVANRANRTQYTRSSPVAALPNRATASAASRVLPIPPAPVRVINRAGPSSRVLICSNSRCRPTKP